MTSPRHSARVDELDAEARYARRRYDLYRAKVYGGRATNPQRLRELQRLSESADKRLAAARSQPRCPPLSGA